MAFRSNKTSFYTNDVPELFEKFRVVDSFREYIVALIKGSYRYATV